MLLLFALRPVLVYTNIKSNPNKLPINRLIKVYTCSTIKVIWVPIFGTLIYMRVYKEKALLLVLPFCTTMFEGSPLDNGLNMKHAVWASLKSFNTGPLRGEEAADCHSLDTAEDGSGTACSSTGRDWCAAADRVKGAGRDGGCDEITPQHEVDR